MRIDVQIIGDEHVRDLLAALRARVIDTRPALLAVAEDFRNIEQMRFLGSNDWAPDTADWRGRKSREGRSTRTLVYTGALERSLTRQGSKYSVRRITRRTLVVGTRDPVAHLVSGGTKKMAARPLLRIDDVDRRRWQDYVLYHLLGVSRGGRGL